jgi:hypothetical protein
MPLINYIGNRQECLDNKRGGRGNAPAPIFLDYLVDGGGQYGNTVAGGGGGVVSGSIRFLPRFNIDVIVGSGGTGSAAIDAEASIIESVPNEFFVYAGPGYGNGTSGEPQNNPKGGDGNYSAGGAGGSAASGSDIADNAIGGAGGSGSFWLDGNAYGGGGGGYGTFFIPGQGVGGAGGVGGGGMGQGFTSGPANGVNNLGGGGGGTLATPTNGGSGIVKLRYLSGSVSGATGGQIQTTGSYTYHIFTGSGQFVYQP